MCLKGPRDRKISTYLLNSNNNVHYIGHIHIHKSMSNYWNIYNSTIRFPLCCILLANLITETPQHDQNDEYRYWNLSK